MRRANTTGSYWSLQFSAAGSGIGKAALHTSIGSLVARGIGVGAVVLAAIALKPAGLGTFAFMSATSALLGALGILGFGPLVTRQIAAAPEDSRDAEDAAVFAMAFTAAALLAIAAAFSLLLDPDVGVINWASGRSRTQIVTIAAWGAVSGFNAVLLAVIVGHRRFALSAAVTAVRAGAGAVGIVVPAFVFHSPIACACGAAIAEAAIACCLVWLLRSRSWLLGSVRRAWRANGRQIVRMSLSAGAASIAIQFALWGVQQLLILSPGGYAANGGLALANRLALVITFLPNAISSAALPILSSNSARPIDPQRLRKIVVTTLGSAALAAVFMAAVVLVGLRFLGAQYAPYRTLILIMCGAAVAIAANNMMSTFAVAARLLRAWIVSDFVLAAGLVAIAWATLGHVGANGVGLAYLAAYALSALMLIPAIGVMTGKRRLQ